MIMNIKPLKTEKKLRNGN